MEKQELIPKLSENVSFHTFSKDSYFIHQSEYNYRIKITNATYDLVKKIDGKKNLQTILLEYGDEIDLDFLFDLFYIKLGKYGIVSSTYVTPKQSEKPNYLKLSFILFPEKLISKITPYLKFLFSPRLMYSILVVCALIIISSLIIKFDFISNHDIKSTDWVLFFILGFISVTFHEIGHASASSFFGAKHGGIGGGFYIFTPVYFADVSDIWKLRPRQRIIVNLAGIYFEFIIGTLYVAIGLITSMNILLIIGLVLFVKSLINLNPFLRSDGYWILSDATNVPNLHRVSRLTLLEFFKLIFTKNSQFKFSLKSVLLTLYAMVNYVVLSCFVVYLIYFNPKSVFYFPYNLYNFISEVIKGNQALTLASISQFILPLLFYYLVFISLKSVFSKRKKMISRNEHSNT